MSRPGLGLDAEANFLDVTEAQPVSAGAESLAGIVVLCYELGPPSWRARPFVAAGAGASRNEIGEVTYAFPGIGREAVTITRGGSHTDFAWTASAGLAIPVGEATIIRPNRTFTLDIAGTRADLETLGAGVSVRYRF